jgi:thiamine kinase-like enzyme
MALAQLVGEETGSYHASASRILGEPFNRAPFPHGLPWSLTADEKLLQSPGYGPAGIQLASLLQAFPDLLFRIRQIASAWQFDCIVHGDLKWDNLLVGPADSGRLRFHVIDWELADVGDASWDVGSVLAAYLSFWLWQAQQSREPSPDLFRPGSDEARDQMRVALGQFWRAYSNARGLSAAICRAYLARCSTFCAARLVTLAYEYLFNNPLTVEFARALIQTSDRLITDPYRFADELVGS